MPVKRVACPSEASLLITYMHSDLVVGALYLIQGPRRWYSEQIQQ